MDLPTVLVKLAGIGLLAWTVRSIVKHVREKKRLRRAAGDDRQSISEQILNNLLLYLWLAFMLTFSAGMILNN